MSRVTFLTLELLVCFVHCYDNHKIRNRLQLWIMLAVKAEESSCLDEEVCPFQHLLEQSNSFLIGLDFSGIHWWKKIIMWRLLRWSAGQMTWQFSKIYFYWVRVCPRFPELFNFRSQLMTTYKVLYFWPCFWEKLCFFHRCLVSLCLHSCCLHVDSSYCRSRCRWSTLLLCIALEEFSIIFVTAFTRLLDVKLPMKFMFKNHIRFCLLFSHDSRKLKIQRGLFCGPFLLLFLCCWGLWFTGLKSI